MAIVSQASVKILGLSKSSFKDDKKNKNGVEDSYFSLIVLDPTAFVIKSPDVSISKVVVDRLKLEDPAKLAVYVNASLCTITYTMEKRIKSGVTVPVWDIRITDISLSK